MKLDISKHGDILEVGYFDLLNERIPAYIEIWTRLIGNDGSAKLIQVSGLDQLVREKREIFAQYHYSAFESIVGMKLIVDNVNKINLESIEGYIQANNEFLAFQAHAGRIPDCVKKMGEFFGIENLERHLYDYYQQRNEVLHGCKIPFMIIEGVLAIPTLMGLEQDPNKWHSDKSWSEVKSEDFDFLSSYLTDSYEGIAGQLNKTLFNLLPKVKDFVDQHKIHLQIPDEKASERHVVSGTNIVDNHIFVTYNTSASASITFDYK